MTHQSPQKSRHDGKGSFCWKLPFFSAALMDYCSRRSRLEDKIVKASGFDARSGLADQLAGDALLVATHYMVWQSLTQYRRRCARPTASKSVPFNANR